MKVDNEHLESTKFLLKKKLEQLCSAYLLYAYTPTNHPQRDEHYCATVTASRKLWESIDELEA